MDTIVSFQITRSDLNLLISVINFEEYFVDVSKTVFVNITSILFMLS